MARPGPPILATTGLSCVFGMLFGIAYGYTLDLFHWDGLHYGGFGYFFGPVVGFLLSPGLLVASRIEHPLILPVIFVPTLIACVALGICGANPPLAMLASGSLYLALGLSTPAWYEKYLAEKPRIPGKCRHCGYDVAGLESGPCPECGRRFRAVEPTKAVEDIVAQRIHGQCSRCGYDIEGVESGKCPECGTRFASVNSPESGAG